VPAAQQIGGPAFERKILDPAAAAGWARAAPRPLVFTNGVFDLLHRGHVTYLARARALGAALLVALNGDASARRLGKGPGRPVNGLADRMALIAALESVDAVTWFNEDTPAALIEACAPDVLVKGGDWAVERMVGAASVLARGGAVHAIPFEHQRSSTALLTRAGEIARAAVPGRARRSSARARKAGAAQSRARRTSRGRRASSAASRGAAPGGRRRARRR
jgi:rfaE bifunctional protein nucleotidyltransferase chain/domain